MRGRRRSIATLLAETLSTRSDARLVAAAAAFAEACGHPLCRETTVRGLTGDGRLLVLVRSDGWARQLEALAPAVCARVNARLGARPIAGLAVEVGQTTGR